jgi:hypothetical protein
MKPRIEYEKLALTFLNFIIVAAAFDWLNSLGKPHLERP